MNKSDRSLNSRKPGRKPVEMRFDFKVEFVEITPDEEPAFREGLSLLLKWIHEAHDEVGLKRCKSGDQTHEKKRSIH